MFLPLGLIALAAAFAAVVAYGTHPHWIELPYGISVIMLARRLQWPAVALSMIASLTLLVVVISGKRRAWWLIGLAPVLALFAHRFSMGDVTRHVVADEPRFVAADQASTLGDDQYVVGLTFADQTFAYPYSALYSTPVIVHSDRERRLVLIWSAFANSAVATTVSRDIKGRELDIVCEPANALLVYNSRIGQFINGLTGRTPGGDKPIGFADRIAVWKGPWKTWRHSNPQTRVMVSAGGSGGPGAPVLPRAPVASSIEVKSDALIALFATTRPLAILSSQIGASPANIRAGDIPLLIFRDATMGDVRAFDRRVEADLIPQFVLNRDPKRKGLFRDVDTNTCWNADGIAVDGEKARLGQKLIAVDVQEQVYWGVAKYWWPHLELINSEPQPLPATPTIANTNTPSAPIRRPRRRR